MKLIINSKEYNIKCANTFFKKLIGFMGKENINYGILFKNTNSIHTFFMKENIDIIGINNQKEVIFKAIDIPKNKVIFINNSIKNTSVIELPANTSKSLKIGQKLTFISE